jgi:NTE family protein
MGADIVIAVDISSQMLTEDQLTSVLSVTEQLTNFLVRRTTDAQIDTLSGQDILIVPELGDFSSADFENADTIVHIGEDTAMLLEPRLSQLSARALGIEQFRPPDIDLPTGQVVIDFVDIDNGSVLNDDLIRSRVDIELGQPLELDTLHSSLDRIYSLDVFKSVTYEHVENDQGQHGLKVNAAPRPWGPNYLQFGLELANDFSGNSDFKLGASYTRNALNSLGGDLRVVMSMGREDELVFDWYQPIDKEARWFVSPRFYWRRENYGLWLDDAEIAELEISGWGTELGIGRNFGTTDQIRLEYEFARGDADILIGIPDLPLNDKLKIGEFVLDYRHDSLDSVWFPTEGTLHRWGYRYAADSLGAAFDYEQLEGNGTLLWTHGRNTLLANYELGYSFDDAAPVERWFRLGGFARLSGLVPNQLSGRHEALLTVAYYRRLNDFKLVPAFAGVTLEGGNVWDFKDDMGFDDLRYSGSVFVGAETPIGPVYLAYGLSDTGSRAAYFYVGNPFRVSRFD